MNVADTKKILMLCAEADDGCTDCVVRLVQEASEEMWPDAPWTEAYESLVKAGWLATDPWEPRIRDAVAEALGMQRRKADKLDGFFDGPITWAPIRMPNLESS